MEDVLPCWAMTMVSHILRKIAVSKTVWWNEYSFATVLSDFSLPGAFDT